MKIETILNAMSLTAYTQDTYFQEWTQRFPEDSNYARRKCQYRAFRARILREFAIYKNFAEANGFDRSQAWFWTDEWQAAEREADEDRKVGDET